MKYSIQQAFIILNEDSDIIDWRDTEEEALVVIKEMEQDDEDKEDMEKRFEEVDN